MKQFENVTVELEGNSYFDGAVTSRTVHFADGSKKTLGFMLPGEYEFGTAAAELMVITSGALDVKLPNSNEWIAVKGGESFDVPADSKFQVNVKSITDYCCSYL
ncbi:MAG TPA: pyrimidine/purine nucleoside phosphorylase [Epsilonproteobacteria bacterium]|nr:pyrimidine/purine nucleoside phosphorylase [Campylobacterota bacterium]